MRCSPSSRSFAEKRGASLFGEALRATSARRRSRCRGSTRRTRSGGRLRQRRGRAADAADVLDDGRGARCGSLRARRRSPSACSPRPAAGWPGWTARRAELGNPKSSLKPRCEGRGEVRVAVDQAGQQRLAAPVVDLRAGVRLEDRIGGADGRYRVAPTASATSSLHVVGRDDDGGVGEDDGGGGLRRRGRAIRAAAPPRPRRLRQSVRGG